MATITAQEKRITERTRLIESLRALSYEEKDKVASKDFQITAALAIVTWLRKSVGGLKNFHLLDTSGVGAKWNPFLAEVEKQVTNFARSDAERDVILARLSNELIAAGVRIIRAKLSNEEDFEPQKIFRRESAMADVSNEITV